MKRGLINSILLCCFLFSLLLSACSLKETNSKEIEEVSVSHLESVTSGDEKEVIKKADSTIKLDKIPDHEVQDVKEKDIPVPILDEVKMDDTESTVEEENREEHWIQINDINTMLIHEKETKEFYISYINGQAFFHSNEFDIDQPYRIDYNKEGSADIIFINKGIEDKIEIHKVEYNRLRVVEWFDSEHLSEEPYGNIKSEYYILKEEYDKVRQCMLILEEEYRTIYKNYSISYKGKDSIGNYILSIGSKARWTVNEFIYDKDSLVRLQPDPGDVNYVEVFLLDGKGSDTIIEDYFYITDSDKYFKLVFNENVDRELFEAFLKESYQGHVDLEFTWESDRLLYLRVFDFSKFEKEWLDFEVADLNLSGAIIFYPEKAQYLNTYNFRERAESRVELAYPKEVLWNNYRWIAPDILTYTSYSVSPYGRITETHYYDPIQSKDLAIEKVEESLSMYDALNKYFIFEQLPNYSFGVNKGQIYTRNDAKLLLLYSDYRLTNVNKVNNKIISIYAVEDEQRNKFGEGKIEVSIVRDDQSISVYRLDAYHSSMESGYMSCDYTLVGDDGLVIEGISGQRNDYSGEYTKRLYLLNLSTGDIQDLIEGHDPMYLSDNQVLYRDKEKKLNILNIEDGIVTLLPEQICKSQNAMIINESTIALIDEGRLIFYNWQIGVSELIREEDALYFAGLSDDNLYFVCH